MEQCAHDQHLANDNIHRQLRQHAAGRGEFLLFCHGTLVLEDGEGTLHGFLGGWFYEGEPERRRQVAAMGGRTSYTVQESHYTLVTQCISGRMH